MKTSINVELVLSVILAILISMCEGFRPTRMRNSHRFSTSAACPIPKIKNGTFRLQRAGRMGYFYCATGFEIHGAMSILCNSGRWKQEIPICIKSGCKSQTIRSNGFVMADEKKQKAMLFCQDGYISAGNTIAFCDGEDWDRELGECRPDVGYSKECDFETTSMCGWTQDTENDFYWAQRNGWNSYEKFEFGPKHDHTKGKPLDGHYMIAEATNSRPSQRSRLLSPVHNQSDSENACFHFYYHMYGHNVGRLRVIVKSIDEDMDEVVDNAKNILFEEEGNQGNQWNVGYFQIEPTKVSFQIIFEATGSKGTINDIAIDDVALLKDGECMKYLKPELVNEEIGGIYDILSCDGRCMETESMRNSGNETYTIDESANRRITEKCDCHQECADLYTCCLDFMSFCGDFQSTDSDVAASRTDNVATEIVPIATMTTTKPAKTSPSTTQKLTITSTASSSTLASTSTSTPASTSTIPTTLKTTTKSKSSNTSVKSNPSTSSTTSTVRNSTSVKPFIITKVPGNAPVILTNVTKSQQKMTEKIIIPMTITTTMPKIVTTTSKINSTEKITVRKMNLITTKPTKSIQITPKPTPKITQATKTTVLTTLKKKVNFVPTKTMIKVTSTTTDATLKAMIMPSDHEFTRRQFIWITTVVLICILSVLMLIGCKRFNGKKWNQFNSNPIEYKSNYNSDNDEAVVRSNSFIIDDSFSATLIDDDDVDEEPKPNTNKSLSKSNKMQSKKVESNTNELNKKKKTCDRSGRKFDQYSERRCLTADDEQFDFSLQANE